MSPFGTIGSSIAGGIGKPNWTFLAMWFSIIVNVSLNLILIPQFGAVGAAYATLAALIVGGVTITCLIHNKMRLAITGKDESLMHQFNTILRIKR
jgi:O-antigen/teichoic acid export membrane protein